MLFAASLTVPTLTSVEIRSAIDPDPLLAQPDRSVRSAIVLMVQQQKALGKLSPLAWLGDQQPPSPANPVVGNGTDVQAACLTAVVVVEDRHPIGIFTQGDGLAWAAQAVDLDGLTLGQVMTPVATLPETELADWAGIVRHLQQHEHLAILDRFHHLIGLLTRETLEQAILRKLYSWANQVEHQAAASESLAQPETEAALQRSEERFRAFMENNPSPVWIDDLEGHLLYANPAYQRSFQVPDNAAGQPLHDIYPADLTQLYLESTQWVATHRQTREMISPGLRRDGSRGEFVVFKFPLPQADGSMTVGGVAIDITDRQKAKQTQRELELLETILETILAGYWDSNLDTGTAYISPGFKRMFGYTDAELPSSPDTWKTLIFPEDLPKALECYARHVQSRGEIPCSSELRCRHKNGSTVWVWCTGRVIEWGLNGQPLRLIGCHVDITPLKQTEEQIRRSALHLKTAQRIGQLGSWEFDLRSGEVTWSDEVFKLFGRDRQQGEPTYAELHQMLHCNDRDRHHEVVQHSIVTGQPYEIECRFYKADGTVGTMLVRGEPVLDSAGQLIQLVGTVLDITQRKQVEDQILQTTAQLAASNRELEAFAYSVSHDLRAPLRAIDGFSLAILEDYGDSLPPEALNYFQRIRHNIQRMGLLIDDLLNLSRVCRVALQFAPVNLSVMVQEYVQELQTAEPDRQVELVVAPNVVVVADCTLMRVVMANLLQNAWKFTSHHTTARIEFGVSSDPQTGQIIYWVRDDGAGFDMAYANMLFGVFQRLHDTHEFPGTGIGLAIVQRAIVRHGGRVWAEGIVEQGATIFFTLPGDRYNSVLENQ